MFIPFIAPNLVLLLHNSQTLQKNEPFGIFGLNKANTLKPLKLKNKTKKTPLKYQRIPTQVWALFTVVISLTDKMFIISKWNWSFVAWLCVSSDKLYLPVTVEAM